MRLRSLRWLIVFFLAMFTVNGIAAVTRACTLSQVRHEHSTIQWQQAKVDATCPEAAAMLCVSHCVQEAKSGEQKAPVDSPPAVIAPPLALTYATFPPVQSPLHVVSSDLVVSPSLTILFGNLRN